MAFPNVSAPAATGGGADPAKGAIEDQLTPAMEGLVRWFERDWREALTLLAIAAGVFLLLLVVQRLVLFVARRAILEDSWRRIAEKVIARTGKLFLAFAALRLVAEVGRPPDVVLGIIRFLFTVVAVVQVAVWTRTFLLGLVRVRSERAEDDTALGLVRALISVGVWAVALLTLLANLGVNITGLIAGLGIGGIAIGLAAQGVLSDLFAAFSIVFDKPFKRGDAIAYEPGAVGVVEEIGIKSTRIRALSGEMVILSNAKLLSATVANYATFEQRRVVLPFGVTYETPAEKLERIHAMVAEIVAAAPLARFERCHLIGFGASSLDHELVFFVEAPGLQEMFDARQAVLIGLIRRFGEAGISFAYPVQVGMLAGPDGTIIDPREEWAAGNAATAARKGSLRP
jgi:small-conductance mechanosensitive channel